MIAFLVALWLSVTPFSDGKEGWEGHPVHDQHPATEHAAIVDADDGGS